MQRLLLALAGILGACGVAFGAAAAHGLEDSFSPQALDWIHKASTYQLWHAAALVGIAALPCNRWRIAAGLLMAVGAILFSTALLSLAFLNIQQFGAIAPIGGTAMILGWITLAASAVFAKNCG